MDLGTKETYISVDCRLHSSVGTKAIRWSSDANRSV